MKPLAHLDQAQTLFMDSEHKDLPLDIDELEQQVSFRFLMTD